MSTDMTYATELMSSAIRSSSVSWSVLLVVPDMLSVSSHFWF